MKIQPESLKELYPSKSFSRCLKITDWSQENVTFFTHTRNSDVLIFYDSCNRPTRSTKLKDLDIWVQNPLPIFGSRGMYINNEEPLLGANEIVQSLRHTFYTSMAFKVIANLYSSGILQHLEEIMLLSRRPAKNLRDHSSPSIEFKTFGTFTTYSRMFIETQYIQLNVERTQIKHTEITPEIYIAVKSVTLNDLLVCWWIYFDGLVLTLVVFFVECIVKTGAAYIMNDQTLKFAYLP